MRQGFPWIFGVKVDWWLNRFYILKHRFYDKCKQNLTLIYYKNTIIYTFHTPQTTVFLRKWQNLVVKINIPQKCNTNNIFFHFSAIIHNITNINTSSTNIKIPHKYVYCYYATFYKKCGFFFSYLASYKYFSLISEIFLDINLLNIHYWPDVHLFTIFTNLHCLLIL